MADGFRREAVSLANPSDVSLKQVAEELGINVGMLGRWRRELGQHGDKAFVGKGPARDTDLWHSSCCPNHESQ